MVSLPPDLTVPIGYPCFCSTERVISAAFGAKIIRIYFGGKLARKGRWEFGEMAESESTSTKILLSVLCRMFCKKLDVMAKG